MKSYPLQWPSGWKRESHRLRAKFNTKTKERYADGTDHYYRSSNVTISEGSKRILKELAAFGVEEGDAIISTNLQLRLDGLPRGSQGEPSDPGVAVYWQRAKDMQHKVMAIDRYDRVADNLAAIAATLEAMRAIERHGGAVILERAFTGFLALPAPNTWRAVMGFTDSDVSAGSVVVRARYKKLSKERHPDCGGTEAQMAELNWAWAEAQKELS